ncbi:MAG: hypothetical protein ABI134_07240 [Byssovorax sp.]
MILEKESLDAVLRDWPAPGVSRSAAEADDAAENPRADDITRAALSATQGDESALAALLEAPRLEAEPGEPPTLVLKEAGGDKKMAQDNESGEPMSSVAPSGMPTPVPAERKRTSLKAMAERASQAGPRSQSSAGAGALSSRGSMPPSATGLPVSGRGSVAPLPRPVEAKSDDSGVVNLNLVKESATPAQVIAAEKAKPGQVDLFDDDRPAAAAKAVAPTPIALAAAPKKSNTGAIAGIAIAVLGLAAAFMVTQRKPPVAPTVAETKPTPAMEAPAATQVAPVETVAVAAPAPSAEPTAAPSAEASARVALSGPMPTGANAGAAAATPAAPAGDGKLAAAAPTVAAPTGKPGDLQSEMIRAAGGTKDPAAAGGTPEPAAGNSKTQNIPEQPSQGSVQAAVGTVMGGAKGCVAGADDVSRANVTFSSGGAVTSVSVTGWAAAHGKSSCVQAALKGAKVGAFSKPSYTVGVTIRP